MKQITVIPPPLPPKTRCIPSGSTTTVLQSSNSNLVYKNSVNQISQSHFSISPESSEKHVVKILINPQDCSFPQNSASSVSDSGSSVRVRVNVDSEMIQKTDTSNKPFFLYGPYSYNGNMSSGQVSPSDTLDSGTGSDLDGTPPPLPKKRNSGVTITLINGQHKRISSTTSSGVDPDSDDNESNNSYDSLNSSDLFPKISERNDVEEKNIFPQNLLRDIRDRTGKNSLNNDRGSSETKANILNGKDPDLLLSEKFNKINLENGEVTRVCSIVDESTYEDRKEQQRHKEETKVFNDLNFDTDKFIKFHINEHHDNKDQKSVRSSSVRDDESFAGYKDLLGYDASTIRSSKGTIRGVKNRVRAGIATFLQINNTDRSYKEKDAGKVVVYTTTMGIVRETYNNCMKVKKILRTLLVKFEERDVFMSHEYQTEVRDRMRNDSILVPQVFVDGQHIGDADAIEMLNETGELRKIMKPYKSMDACSTCQVCGGYRLLPCSICNGSKKSLHRNHFTTEFVALKCMNCDEVGLVKCTNC